MRFNRRRRHLAYNVVEISRAKKFNGDCNVVLVQERNAFLYFMGGNAQRKYDSRQLLKWRPFTWTRQDKVAERRVTIIKDALYGILKFNVLKLDHLVFFPLTKCS